MPVKEVQVKKIKHGGISKKSVYIYTTNKEYYNFLFDSVEEAGKFIKECDIKEGDILEIDYEIDKERKLNIVKSWKKILRGRLNKPEKQPELKPWGTLQSKVTIKEGTPLMIS